MLPSLQLPSLRPQKTSHSKSLSPGLQDVSIDRLIVPKSIRGELSSHQIHLLAESIRTRGLIEPLTVAPNGLLIHGHYRLEALKYLGRKMVWVNVLTSYAYGQSAVFAEIYGKRS